MECDVPKYWSPACFDVIYTNINTYRNYFASNNFHTRTNYSGFDERISKEINNNLSIEFDTVFVGGLGSGTFKDKTEFLESFLELSQGRVSFAWWGYKENSSFNQDYPYLANCYKGVSGGLDMFAIYKNAKIVLNDYGLNAGGQGINQRIYEVLGSGGFLLTRNSSVFNEWKGCIATFDDVGDCYEKVCYYLNNEEERLDLAQKGNAFVLNHFNYKSIMAKLSTELVEDYQNKFGKRLNS